MCLDCGCMKPNDDHGDIRHLTMKQVEDAAKASEISVRRSGQEHYEYDEGCDGGKIEEGRLTINHKRGPSLFKGKARVRLSPRFARLTSKGRYACISVEERCS